MQDISMKTENVAGKFTNTAALSIRRNVREGSLNILFVPPIPQQIQISVDQHNAGPAASCCGIIGTHSISGGKRARIIGCHHVPSYNSV
jgi:hypothetical protein